MLLTRTMILGVTGLLLLSLAGNLFANGEVHRYKKKSAILVLAYEGNLTGSDTIYFDQWGMREAKYTHTEMKMMGMSIKTNQLTLMRDGFTYTVNLDDNTSTKMETPLLKELSEGAKSQGKDFTDIGEEMLKNMGGKKEGTGTILGKECDIWFMSNMNTRVWIWNGITMKSETNMGGIKMKTEVVSLEVDVDIPEKKLTLPAGLKVKETQNPFDILKKMRGQN